MMSSSFTARPGRHRWPAFLHEEAGAILVEFALVLPMMLLVFAMVVESSRFLWSYQSAIGGVRDAARYLSRSAPADICKTGGSVSGYAPAVYDMVALSIARDTVMPGGIAVVSVTPSLVCRTGSYRGGTVAVVQISAEVRMTFPFAGPLGFFGVTIPTKTTTITDRSRIIGA
jgi:Flp pilus assembly protein TadG